VRHHLSDTDAAGSGLFAENRDFILRDARDSDRLVSEVERGRNLKRALLLLPPALAKDSLQTRAQDANI
jgi:hypothetical protein